MLHAGKVLPVMVLLLSFIKVGAQQTTLTDRIDASQISVGDPVRVFIEVHHNDKLGKLQWATIPDTFNTLEVREKGKIDTLKQGGITTYKQRITITGFDSGIFKIPSFYFTVQPNSGTPYTVQSDSFQITVQTLAVDTTKAFKGIKEIIQVKSSWLDYIWYIVGAIILIILVVFIALYFIKNRKVQLPVGPKEPEETFYDKALRQLTELEQKHMWQNGQVKQYYIELTDILRSYIEDRFRTPAMELTTDELLAIVMRNKEMVSSRELLSGILYTADLAKFAKAEPLPAEHVSAMEQTMQFINTTKPVIIETKPEQS